ncbi:hypothetical protein [Arthrobacter sp. MMS18-M83]|nr:hypothetical protein [Arthrobacter sp. MMS18-M83]WAH97739.1 hypothetical protein OW521_02225 [Arthrobacter sp. MMS18-M83]
MNATPPDELDAGLPPPQPASINAAATAIAAGTNDFFMFSLF